ncbi:Sugar kinase of the NBD/HSP70 family, may contain an N-terminal HTH domain [Actinomadura mexicana]|uniref:Sugar kinase of the NBD/HSP70 family, may contain an N-terminal HTH domain n=1 Tax=Actinomadura mexicana TaxID=134959 RepID=A0A239FP63_9ACTN|nr:Sugar kinase of the NBD/HSP70 family, may contain an N-terminal HTH domain [Actinomadura mexicana]
MGGVKTADPTMARAINDRLALDLLLERGPLTAPQLRTLTGLSRPTVSDLIERLRAGGLIEAAGETGADRRGPNARLYGLVADRAHVAGVDLRRDAVHVSVADIAGNPAGSASRPLPPSPDLCALVADAVTEAAGGRALHTVVLGTPGLIDPRTGRATDSGVPGGRPDLGTALRDRLGAPVRVENEVNLGAIAEHREGAAAGRDDFALLWLDDGVGGALVLDGRLRRGASGGAGEVGLLKVGGTDFCALLDGAAVAGLGDEAVAGRIAEAVFVLVAVLDPGLVVLGGSLGRAGGDRLAGLVAAHLGLLSPAATEVRPGRVEGDAVLRGAVLTALDLVRDDVFG